MKYTSFMYFFSYLEPVCFCMSSLTVASWPAYRFLKRQVSGLVFPSLSEFSTVYCGPQSQRLWHSKESRNRCFSGTSCFFDDPVDVGTLISGSSAFSKTGLNIWKFTVHVLLKPGLQNFEHYFTFVRWVQLCGSLSILWHCLSLELEWKLTFSSPVATAEFSKFAYILSAALSQHHLSGFEIALLEFHHLH